MVGCPGSGKTLIATQLVIENPGYIVLSMDLLTESTGFNPDKVGEVIAAHHETIVNAMRAKIPGIIVDDTNTSLTGRRRLLDLAREFGYIGKVLVVNRGLCPEQLAQETIHSVPLETIQRMYGKLVEQGLY